MKKRVDRINNFRYPISQPTVFDEEELTVLRLVGKVAYKINETVGEVNNWIDYLDVFVEAFDENLQDKVIKTLTDWQDCGLLDDIINELLQPMVTETLTEWQDNGLLDIIINDALQTQMDVLEDETQRKLCLLEMGLEDYKSTIASINVNQEVKQSVSGYGVVSLPKNSANGQVSVSVKGNTETDEEYNTKSTQSAMRLKSVGKNLFDGKLETGNWDITTGLKQINTNATRCKTHVQIKPNTIYILSGFTVGKDSWIIFYDADKEIISNKQGRTYFTSPPNAHYLTFYRTNTTGILTDKVQLEENTQATPYEPYTESTQYLPNVGELRSLPNGVKDEIRVSGGKAELVKRIDNNIEELAEPVVTPIEVSGTLLSYPNGTVYIEPLVEGGTQGETTIEYYESRSILKDSVTGKFYKIFPSVTGGVLTIQLVEV